ncbi:MAG: aminotransferase class I/II-fold pyridoxal phosphate-dependent enzyme, partial [Myxococcales bacterium]|nr:aminotransferase class I/II-fold pyridoxal phosphate-dependent enzyme [Myxococcales bacterium]
LYLLGQGGKRVRPLLALAAAKACGGNPQRALPLAASVEWLHQGSLVLDDIIDDARVRRGAPPLHTATSDAFATGITVFLFARVLRRTHAMHPDIRKHLVQAATALAEGERLELQHTAMPQVSITGYFAIIEDDYDHEVHYQGSPVLPLAHHDRHGAVIYIGTLSKVLAPGLRLGFVSAGAPVLEQALRWRGIIDRQGDLATEAAIAELFEDGEVQRHIGRVRRIYQRRRQALLATIERRLPGAFAIELPRGGMALWAPAVAGDDTDLWAERALARGVAVQPAGAYWLGRGKVHGFRLGFAALDEGELDEAVRRLAQARPRKKSV